MSPTSFGVGRCCRQEGALQGSSVFLQCVFALLTLSNRLEVVYRRLTGRCCALQRSAKIQRVFAVTTAVDLVATILLTLLLLLLTFTPALSQPFSTFLCSSSFAQDLSTPSSLSSSHHPSSHSSSSESFTLTDSLALLLWGVETCEDNWRSGMVRVILGSAVASVIRTYGVCVTWEANAELKENEQRERGEGWVDQEMAEVEAREEERAAKLQRKASGGGGGGRQRSASSSSSGSSHRRGSLSERRSSTLPLYTDAPSSDCLKHLRSQSIPYSSDGSKPQLVLVPCVLDSHGHPVYSPSSPTFTIPPYTAGPSRSRSSSSTSSYPPPPSSPSSSRSSSRASSKRSYRPRSSSSFSSMSSYPPHYHSPLAASDLMAFTDEPSAFAFDLEAAASSASRSSSPPSTPTTLTSAAVDESAVRRARSRSENDASAAGAFSPSSSVAVPLPSV